MKTFGVVVQTKSLEEFKSDPQGSIEQVIHSEARIMVQKDGVALAVLISVADLDELQQLESERDRDFAVLEEIRETFKDIPAEEIEREAEISIQNMRLERHGRSADTPTDR